MTHRHIRSIAIALAATAAIAAPASASAQDLRSPDAADPSGQPTVANLDLRTPDAADPSRGAPVDLRSPDAADPYSGVPYSGVPVQVVDPAPVVSVREVDAGFDWGDAGLGAGALFALALLGVGGSVIVKRHGPALS